MKRFIYSLMAILAFSGSAFAYDPYRPRLYEPPSYRHVPPMYRYQAPPPHPYYHAPYHYGHKKRRNDVAKGIAIGAGILMLGIILNEAARR